MHKKSLLGLFLASLLMGATACGGADETESGKGSSDDEKPAQEQKQGQAKGPQPDLKGIPKVVAEVNGEEIRKDEFVQAYKGQYQQSAMQSQTSGQKVDQDKLKKQTLDQMIGTELLVQEADSRDFTASDKEVDQKLGELAKQNGLKSADKFMAAVKNQGISEQEVRSQLRTQVKLDQLIAAEAGNTEPTDKEVKQLYDQLKAQQKQSGSGGSQASKLPPLKQVRPQLEEQVKSQKESQAAGRLIGELRKDADVTINL